MSIVVIATEIPNGIFVKWPVSSCYFAIPLDMVCWFFREYVLDWCFVDGANLKHRQVNSITELYECYKGVLPL